jgi:homoserine/homoserine lactone efflux protein
MHGSLFSAFLLITAVLYVTPGSVVTLVVTTAARDGVRAGLMTVGGGVVGHAALLACIAFGLSWILWASAESFRLSALGRRRVSGVARRAGLAACGDMDNAAPPRGHVHVWRGVVVAITNPKTLAFITAFSATIHRSDAADPTPIAGDVRDGGIFDSSWAIAAGYGRMFFIKPWHNRLLGRFSGLVLIGGGVCCRWCERGELNPPGCANPPAPASISPFRRRCNG